MDTKIDPVQPLRWLDRVDGALVIPSDGHDILARIVQPFEAELSDLHLLMLAQVSPVVNKTEDQMVMLPSVPVTPVSSKNKN